MLYPLPALAQEVSLCLHDWTKRVLLSILFASGVRLSLLQKSALNATGYGRSQLWRQWLKRNESGQGLIEYALVFCGIGVVLSALWQLISSLGISEVMRAVVHVTYGGWADFLLRNT